MWIINSPTVILIILLWLLILLNYIIFNWSLLLILVYFIIIVKSIPLLRLLPLADPAYWFRLILAFRVIVVILIGFWQPANSTWIRRSWLLLLLYNISWIITIFLTLSNPFNLTNFFILVLEHLWFVFFVILLIRLHLLILYPRIVAFLDLLLMNSCMTVV